ncbi:MAG: dienelactone hydrolase family protein [Thermomicrobiales bacterium]|nr:dienelactone hydrolase family protein [Thermomicrobiales bacterium]
MVLLHGRGASAEDILGLTDHLPRERVAYVAPQAAGHTWYPERFTEPIERNEPWLSSALALVERIIDEVIAAGIPAERIGLLGFSQGACLALEFAARHPRRYGGVFALSGGLIGPPGTVWDDRGSLGGTPVFLGCSDVDSHIPAERVIESGERMRELGAEVEVRLYPGMGHTINRDELDIIRRGVERMVAADPAPLE